MSEPGARRRRVDIQAQKQVQDGTGASVPQWVSQFRAVPCSILANIIRASEAFAANQVQSDMPWRVVMTWRPGIDASMRLIEYQDQARSRYLVYNIEAVMPDATNRREITIFCRTRLQEGFRTDGS